MRGVFIIEFPSPVMNDDEEITEFLFLSISKRRGERRFTSELITEIKNRDVKFYY